MGLAADVLKVVYAAVEGGLKGTPITMKQETEQLNMEDAVEGGQQEKDNEWRLAQTAGREEHGCQWEEGAQHEDSALEVDVENDGHLLVAEFCAVGQTLEETDAELEYGVFHVCCNLPANVDKR